MPADTGSTAVPHPVFIDSVKLINVISRPSRGGVVIGTNFRRNSQERKFSCNAASAENTSIVATSNRNPGTNAVELNASQNIRYALLEWAGRHVHAESSAFAWRMRPTPTGCGKSCHTTPTYKGAALFPIRCCTLNASSIRPCQCRRAAFGGNRRNLRHQAGSQQPSIEVNTALNCHGIPKVTFCRRQTAV